MAEQQTKTDPMAKARAAAAANKAKKKAENEAARAAAKPASDFEYCGEDGLRWVFVQRSTNKVITMEIPRGNPLTVGSAVSVELTVRGTGLNAAVKDALRT